MSDFEKIELVGCAGNMDIVHISRDQCLAALKVLYEEKKGYPIIGFQVISSH